MQVCTHSGKKSFPTPQAANDTAQRIRTRGAYKAKVYKCPHCDGWHLSGHTSFKRIHAAIRTGKPTQPYKRDRSAWIRGGEE